MNFIGPNGVMALRKLLESGHKLYALNISGCMIHDEGAKELAKGIKRNNSLEILCLSIFCLAKKLKMLII